MFVRNVHEPQQVTFGSGFEKKVLLKKISEMEDLPSLGANVTNIINLLRDQNVAINDLVDAIERDQSLVAKLLKIINSAYYSLRSTVDSVERAILLLGILKVKHEVYSASIVDFYSDDHLVEWNHAYTSSSLVGKLMKEHAVAASNDLALAMLMHDIGKVVLRRYSANRFKNATERALADDIPLFQAEEIVIGIDHAAVGGMLLEKWEMPVVAHMAARMHHGDEIPAEYGEAIALVQYADWIDCQARAIKCLPPSDGLIRIAGLTELDSSVLIEQQRQFIEAAEKAEGASA